MFQKTHRITDGLNEPRLMNMRHLNKKFNIKEELLLDKISKNK
jgi:hypothetical protein